MKLRLAPNLAKLSKLNRINSIKSEAEMNESPVVLSDNELCLSPNKVTFDQESLSGQPRVSSSCIDVFGSFECPQ